MANNSTIQIRERTFDLKNTQFSPAIPLLLQRIYAARGITAEADLERTLAGLPKPAHFRGLDEAITLLQQALAEDWRILIVGDFDADGATSTALVMLALKAMGGRAIDFLVPNRFDYGYGLTPEIVHLACERNPQLIITVDNGISSVAGVAVAKAAGIHVLITDHHLPGRELPDADAIVNPNQVGCAFPGKNLAGVGVVFYLLTRLRSHLRESGWFAKRNLAEPNMATWLDLVALGTVADVVPLDRTNRILVHQGLERIRAGQTRPGIQALLSVAGRDGRRLTATDLGFAIGPRLNAAGRLDDMSIGIQCLLEEDPYRAREYAAQLDELNRDRRSIEAGMQQQALAILERLHFDETAQNAGELPWGLCLFDADWHQGVVGLLASRIKDRLHRPVIAFAPGENGDLKGSARSITGLHIRDALDAIAVKHPGLINKFGGHAMAAGLSLARDNYDAFAQAFDGEVRQQLSPADLHVEILTDGELSADQLSLSTARLIQSGGPWGQHFPEPVFSGHFYLVQQRIVGHKHLKMVLAVDPAGQQTFDAIAFNVDTHLWPDNELARVRVVYRLDINVWRGRESAQLIVEHLLKDFTTEGTEKREEP